MSQRLFLDITTNGKLLTTEKLDKLFEAGLDNVNINDYRSDRDQNDILSPNIENIWQHYGNNPKVTIKKRRTDEQLPNYAGNISQSFDASEYGFCNYPFRKLTIAYNGNVLLCCDDFLYDTKFGNVMHDKLIDCWNNTQYNNIRKSLLENKRIGICARCDDSQDYNTF
jgi:radical SAM protein with 4Fe4S-binding SPASM domain